MYDVQVADLRSRLGQKGQLAEGVPAPGLSGGKLENIVMPSTTGKWSLFYGDNSMEDLWVALT